MTAPLSKDRLAEITALEAAATAGPWLREDDSTTLTRWVTDERGVLDISFGYVGNNTQDDARFVAMARTAVPELLAEVARLKTLVGPEDGITQVRVLPTKAGTWRVRYRHDGRRRSSSQFETEDAARAWIERKTEQARRQLYASHNETNPGGTL